MWIPGESDILDAFCSLASNAFIHSSIHPFIHSSIHPSILPSMHPSINPSFHCCCCSRYVRVLGAFYLRLVGKALDVYQYLEPLYNDYRKLRMKMADGCRTTTLFFGSSTFSLIGPWIHSFQTRPTPCVAWKGSISRHAEKKNWALKGNHEQMRVF